MLDAIEWLRTHGAFDAAGAVPAQRHFVDAARALPDASGIAAAQGPSARERALLSDDVHRDTAVPPAGYRLASDGEVAALGLQSRDSGAAGAFDGRLRVYARESQQGSEYVVALAGDAARSAFAAQVERALESSSTRNTVIRAETDPGLRSAPDSGERGPLGRAAEIAAFYIGGERLSAVQDGGLAAVKSLFGGPPPLRMAA